MIKINHEFAKSSIQNGNGVNHLKVLVDVETQKETKRNTPIAVSICLDNSGSMDMTMGGIKDYDYTYSTGTTAKPQNPYAQTVGNPFTYTPQNPFTTEPVIQPYAPVNHKLNQFDMDNSFVNPIHKQPVSLKRERRGSKMDYAKMSAVKIVESLNENDYFGLVIFDDLAYVVVELQQIGENKQKIINQINRIQTRGCTNMFDGLRKVEDQFTTIEDLDITKKLIVLSDGQVNEGVRDLGQFAEKAYQFFHKYNIGISTIGFGTDYNLELMSMLANKGEGNFYHLKNSEEIYTIIENELKIINSIVARNTMLTLTIPKGFTFEENLNSFDEEYVDDMIQIKLGNLYTSKYIIFPIALLRKIRNKKVTFNLGLKYKNIDDEDVEVAFKAILPISNDPTEVAKENTELIKEVAETLKRKAILNATVEFENTGGYATSSAYVSSNMVNLTASYSTAKNFVSEYQESFDTVLKENSHDVDQLRMLNSKTMYDIKNKD